MNKNEINVALCTDDNYASHCAICVCSILENHKDCSCHIYILTTELNVANRNRFEQLSKVYNQQVEIISANDEIFKKLQVTNHLGRAMYLRFLLPQFVKSSKLLYLDSDIIVRHSLCPLFEINMDGIACGVVEDQNGDDIRLHNPIKMFSRYFNSGVLLMNLDYWRENNIANKLMQWIENFPGQLACPDQDALNKVLEHKVIFLDYTYNFQQGFYGNLTWLRADKWESVHRALKDPTIVHFTAGEKPWHKDCVHPLRGDYDYYMHLHSFLSEQKTNGHNWHFYVVEKIIGRLRSIYQWYRIKNGMYVNQI